MKNLLFRTLLFSLFFSLIMIVALGQQRQMREPGLQDELLHKDFRPQSIFKTPQTQVLKAKYPAIDMHMHAPRRGDMETNAAELLKNMDESGIEKTILFCGIGETFDNYAAVFGKYPDRIEMLSLIHI